MPSRVAGAIAIEALKEQQTTQELAQKYDRTADAAASQSDFRLESDGSGRPSPTRQEFLQNSASVFIPSGNRQGEKKEQ